MIQQDHLSQPNIAIIGGGVGGLMLARLLYLANIDFTVFERDESATARTQGGTLDMHPKTGLYAIQQAGLFDEFKQVARYQHQGVRLYDEQANLLYSMDNAIDQPNPTPDNTFDHRPEIDRGELRRLLLNSFPDKHIAWNHRTKQVTLLENGQFRIDFDNQPSVTADFVVGADGAWSKVRPLLSAYQPEYIGTAFFDFTIHNFAQDYPQLAELVGNGLCVAGIKPHNIDHSSSVQPQPELTLQLNGDGSARLYARLWIDCKEVDEMDKSRIQAHYRNWSDKLVAAFSATQDSPRPWMIFTLPETHHWQHRSNITLIGDAAHLMPPSGEGANLALKDAVELANALQHTDFAKRDNAVHAFEQQMFQRSHASAKASLAYIEALRAGQGIQALLEMLTS